MTVHLPPLLFLLPFVAALVCAAAGPRRPRLAAGVAGGAMLLTMAAGLLALFQVARHGTLRADMDGWAPPVGIEWVLDPLGALMAALVGGVGAAAVLGAGPGLRLQMPRRQSLFYACALLLVSGLMGMVLTADLFNLFVQLELASLCAYALVAAGPGGGPRAAMRYLVVGSLGASMYLLGVGFVYAATGTLNMADMAARLPASEPRLALSGVVLMVAGLGVKMGLFPLHMWMPAAYARGPAAGSALMAPLVTKVAGYALLRLLFWVYQVDYLRQHGVLLQLLCLAGALAMVYGAAKAAMEEDLWRMLAYSSVSQMGLVALGAGLASTHSLTGAVLHLASDALTKGALFAAVGVMLVCFGIRRRADLPRMRGRAPWSSAIFVVGGLSLLGLPPLPGFYGKWYVLWAALQMQHWLLAAAVVLGTLATAVYVLRLIEAMFFLPAPPADQGPAPAAPAPVGLMVTTGAVLAGVMVAAGLLMQPIVTRLIQPALPGGL